MHFGSCGHAFALLLLPNLKLPRICYTMSEKGSYSGESNSNQLPSFFKNSCTGADSIHEDTGQSIISVVEDEGQISHSNWTKSLQHFPGFSENKIEEALIEQSGSFSKRYNAPKTCKSKKLGYRLWKEGFVRSIFVAQCPGINAYVLGQMQSTRLDEKCFI